MKLQFFLGVFCLCMLAFSAAAIHPPDDVCFYDHDTTISVDDAQQSIDNTIYSAIQTGNSQDLSKSFFDSIELTLPGFQGTYSKSQAEQLMRNFFKLNPPKSFTINNEGTSAAQNTRFSIGTYISENGKNFRVYFLRKEINKKNLITILKFE